MTLLTPSEAAALLKVTTRTLRSWRHQKRGPTFVTLGPGTIRYAESDLVSYIQDMRRPESVRETGGSHVSQ